ncbi:MAG: acyltransferase family protein [Alistipes sp.]
MDTTNGCSTPRTLRKTDRMVYIDIAKALCIVLVVVGHYTPAGCPVWWQTIHDIIYTFHMPLFMFASGFVYVATKKDEKYKDFIIKKIRRLMIPYFVVSAIVIGIKLVADHIMYVQHPKTAMSFVRMFYYPEAGAFLWFIYALWWMFVVVPLFKTKRQRLVLFFMAIILHYVPFAVPDVFCLAEFKNMLIYFMLGVVLYDWKHVFAVFGRVPKSVYILLFAAVCAILTANVGEIWRRCADFVAPFLGIAATVSLSKAVEQSKIRKDWLLVTSASSYMIYLFHTTFEGLAKAVLVKIPYFNDTTDGFAFLIGAVLVVSCGVVLPIVLNEKILKKYTLTKVLFGLK